MADKKISALTAATTPLAGTEVLPIVQGGATVKVSVDNLTTGKAVTVGSLTDAGNLTFTGTGNRILGDFSNATAASRVAFQSSTTNGATILNILPNGTNTVSYLAAFNNSDPTNSSTFQFLSSSSESRLNSNITGTGTYLPMTFYTGGSEAMRINTDRNVGIGTISPSVRLDVVTSGDIPQITASNGTVSQRVGYAAFGLAFSGTSSNHPYAILVNDTERMRIDTNGIFTMNAYGAGAATFSAAGVISSVSDETWKTKDGVPINPDEMLQKLEPGYWFYNEEKAPIFGADRQLGFYAQNVNAAIGDEAAPVPEEGKPWGYYDRSVLAVTVMSLKNALNTIKDLTARLKKLEAK
jgi:hypothetical protein